MQSNSISTAQQLLLDHPFDIYHDIFHHYKVWENSRKITFIEKLKVDTNPLDIACWWHDIFKGEKDNSLLIKTLSDTNIDTDTLDTAIAIINQHSFGEEQTLLESKILYDADKIEYISLTRWQAAFEACDKGFISVAEKERYISA
ncbi:hypothetical protein KA078_00500 [Candidatus Woesebacteria bacterium]|nr:hypothetical protein [Candidatus Woesebacteria bacterium]